MLLLSEVHEETFGERLHRARVRQGVHLRDVAKSVSACWPVSYGLIHRLESTESVPVDRRRRVIAALVAIAIGYEPEAFGLSRADIPRGIDVAALTQATAAGPGVVSRSWLATSQVGSAGRGVIGVDAHRAKRGAAGDRGMEAAA